MGDFFIESNPGVGVDDPGNEIIDIPELLPPEPSPTEPSPIEPSPLETPPPGFPPTTPTPSPAISITPMPNETESDQRISLDNVTRRKTAVLAGFEYQYNVGAFSLSAQLLGDVSSVHDGHEFRLGISHPFSLGSSDFGFALGGIWQDQKLLDYYYGIGDDDIQASEINITNYLYVVEDGDWSPFSRVDWRYQLNDNWSLVARIQMKMLADAIKESPLVEEDFVFTGFVGGVYRF